MFGHVTKLGIASLVIGGIALQTDVVQEPVTDLVDWAQSAVVQAEVDGMAKMVYMDYVACGELPRSSELASFLRRNSTTVPGANRDPARDHWGNFIILERGGSGFSLVSAGPDGIYGNDDDVISGYDWD